jgi:hypothetical protein
VKDPEQGERGKQGYGEEDNPSIAMEFAGQEFWVDSSAKHGNRKNAEAVLGDGKWNGQKDQQCLPPRGAEQELSQDHGCDQQHRA